MSILQILAPFLAAGVGMAAAYGVTHSDDFKKRIHFVERDNLSSELEDLEIDIQGMETCEECGDEIPTKDVGAFVRVDGHYKAVCDKPKCLDTYDIE